MKKYNYFHDRTPITKQQFISNVPADWEKEVNEFGEYSHGAYRAVEI
jgi:hypothetical protein